MKEEQTSRTLIYSFECLLKVNEKYAMFRMYKHVYKNTQLMSTKEIPKTRYLPTAMAVL